MIEDILPKTYTKMVFSRDLENENRRVLNIEGENYENFSN